MGSNFLLGHLKIIECARFVLKRQPYDLIARHAINEHGHITEAERVENKRGIRTLGPGISRYRSDPTNQQSPIVTIVTRELWDETLVDVYGGKR